MRFTSDSREVILSIESTQAIQKNLKLLALNLSESELNELQSGNIVSLEHRDLSEIGSLFILAAAVSASKLSITKKKFTFQDLPKVVSESAHCPGIPICDFDIDSSDKCCLYLTLIDGKLGLQIGVVGTKRQKTAK